jgi:uncharacterized membrane protein
MISRRLSLLKAAFASGGYRRLVLAWIMEFTGLGLIVYGIWFFSPIASLIAVGAICLLLAYGITD